MTYTLEDEQHPRENEDAPQSCTLCHADIPSGEGVMTTIVSEALMCEPCFDVHGAECPICGECGHQIDMPVGSDERHYCPDCFENEFVHCDLCETVIPLEDARSSPGGTFVCASCEAEYYVRCCDCGSIMERENARYMDDDEYEENPRCRGCHQTYARRHNQGIHDYSYRPNMRFHCLPAEKAGLARGIAPLYLGFELEVDDPDDEKDEEDASNIARALTRAMNTQGVGDLVYCKHDGSLSDGGFEIVSHPTTFAWWKEHHELLKPIFALPREGLRSFQTDTCGMHVHLSRKAFTPMHLYRFLRFFYRNAPLIAMTSRRARHNLDQWASLRLNATEVKLVKRTASQTRYTAVNLQNENTVEIRVFRGTLSPDGFWMNLEFVQSAFEFTRTAGARAMTESQYLRYVEKHRKSYKHLYAYYVRRGKIVEHCKDEQGELVVPPPEPEPQKPQPIGHLSDYDLRLAFRCPSCHEARSATDWIATGILEYEGSYMSVLSNPDDDMRHLSQRCPHCGAYVTLGRMERIATDADDPHVPYENRRYARVQPDSGMRNIEINNRFYLLDGRDLYPYVESGTPRYSDGDYEFNTFDDEDDE